jgi:hypothetical protein
VQFADQVIYTEVASRRMSIPQGISGGHSGLVIIDDESGLTRYREYGRYPGGGEVRGAVRDTIRLPDLVYEDGLPTRASITALYNRLLDIGGRNNSDDLRLTWRPESDDYDAMMSEADRWDREVEYSATGRRTCHDFCGAVSNEGGGRRGIFNVRLNPNNVDDAVQRTRDRLERHRDQQRRRDDD